MGFAIRADILSKPYRSQPGWESNESGGLAEPMDGAPEEAITVEWADTTWHDTPLERAGPRQTGHGACRGGSRFR